MNIHEAMKESKETGQSYSRLAGGGWIRYKENFNYRLTESDLLATDWVTTSEMVRDVTKGNWVSVEEDAN